MNGSSWRLRFLVHTTVNCERKPFSLSDQLSARLVEGGEAAADIIGIGDTFLNVTQIEGGLFMIPILGLIGGTLGFLGGLLFRPRPQPKAINET